jgi:hypothetical protein
MSEKLLYRAHEARDALGVGNTKFWAMVKAGVIETRKLDGITVVTAECLHRLVKNLPTT